MPAGTAMLGMLGGLMGGAENSSNIQSQEDWMQQMNVLGPSEKMLGLQMAHVNPMLAVSGGVSPLMGMPNIQTNTGANPMAGVQAQIQQNMAQTRLTNAQAASIEQQTPGPDTFPVDPATGKIDLNAYASGQGVHIGGNLTAMGQAQNLQQGQAQIRLLNQQVDTSASLMNLQDWQASMQNLTQQQLRQTIGFAVKQAQADLNLTDQQIQQGQADAAILGSKWGTIIRAAQMILGPAHSALSLGTRILGAAQ